MKTTRTYTKQQQEIIDEAEATLKPELEQLRTALDEFTEFSEKCDREHIEYLANQLCEAERLMRKHASSSGGKKIYDITRDQLARKLIANIKVKAIIIPILTKNGIKDGDAYCDKMIRDYKWNQRFLARCFRFLRV